MLQLTHHSLRPLWDLSAWGQQNVQSLETKVTLTRSCFRKTWGSCHSIWTDRPAENRHLRALEGWLQDCYRDTSKCLDFRTRRSHTWSALKRPELSYVWFSHTSFLGCLVLLKKIETHSFVPSTTKNQERRLHNSIAFKRERAVVLHISGRKNTLVSDCFCSTPFGKVAI